MTFNSNRWYSGIKFAYTPTLLELINYVDVRSNEQYSRDAIIKSFNEAKKLLKERINRTLLIVDSTNDVNYASALEEYTAAISFLSDHLASTSDQYTQITNMEMMADVIVSLSLRWGENIFAILKRYSFTSAEWKPVPQIDFTNMPLACILMGVRISGYRKILMELDTNEVAAEAFTLEVTLMPGYVTTTITLDNDVRSSELRFTQPSLSVVSMILVKYDAFRGFTLLFYLTDISSSSTPSAVPFQTRQAGSLSIPSVPVAGILCVLEGSNKSMPVLQPVFYDPELGQSYISNLHVIISYSVQAFLDSVVSHLSNKLLYYRRNALKDISFYDTTISDLKAQVIYNSQSILRLEKTALVRAPVTLNVVLSSQIGDDLFSRKLQPFISATVTSASNQGNFVINSVSVTTRAAISEVSDDDDLFLLGRNLDGTSTFVTITGVHALTHKVTTINVSGQVDYNTSVDLEHITRNYAATGTASVRSVFTVKVPNAKMVIYITKFWHYPPIITTAPTISGTARITYTRSDGDITIMDFRNFVYDGIIQLETVSMGTFYVLSFSSPLLTKDISFDVIKNVGPFNITTNTLGQADVSVTGLVHPRGEYINRDVLLSNTSGVALMYQGKDEFVIRGALRSRISKLMTKTILTNYQVVINGAVSAVNEGNELNIYRNLATSKFRNSAYKIALLGTVNEVSAVNDQIVNDLKDLRATLTNMTKPTALNTFVSVANDVALTLSLVQPQIGMILMGMTALLDLVPNNDPVRIAADLTQLVMGMHVAVLHPVLTSVRMSEISTNLERVISSGGADTAPASNVVPFFKWRLIETIKRKFISELAPKVVHTEIELSHIERLRSTPPSGTIKRLVHEYVPFSNKTTPVPWVENLRVNYPTVYESLRTINLAPEHAKLHVELPGQDVDGNLIVNHFIFGVTDFVGARVANSANSNRLTGFEKNSDSFAIGGIRTGVRFGKNGKTSILTYSECGYTATQAENLILENMPEYSYIDDINDKWEVLTNRVVNTTDYTSDQVAYATRIPTPNVELASGLLRSLMEGRDTFSYYLPSANCQSVATDITDFLVSLRRPSWLPATDFSGITGRAAERMLDTPV